jgi:hypothetical protein
MDRQTIDGLRQQCILPNGNVDIAAFEHLCAEVRKAERLVGHEAAVKVEEDSQKKARTDQDALVEGVELRQSGKSLEDAATEAKCDVRQLRAAVSRLQAQRMGPGGTVVAGKREWSEAEIRKAEVAYIERTASKT